MKLLQKSYIKYISGISQELENVKTYPVEIIEGLLYMGDQKQGMDTSILKDLKICAIVNVTQGDTLE